MVDPEKLKALADRIDDERQRGGWTEGLLIESSEALREAAGEIETLKLTAQATTELAQRAAVQSVLDRRIKDGLQEENSRLHDRNTDLSAKVRELEGRIGNALA